MTANSAKEVVSFQDTEKYGWSGKASNYDDYLGLVTKRAISPMLNAVDAASGTRLLEVACGPGYGAGLAAARGGIATGIDFAPRMVEEARKAFPDAKFQQGNAEALDFEDASFDAVICPFGMLHFGAPDIAMSEAFRVLKPGGRYAFTVWWTADKAQLFGFLVDVIQTHGNLDVPLPPAPPFFRFSDNETSRNALERAGFTEVRISELPSELRINEPKVILDFIDKSTVRTAALLKLQTNSARAKIQDALLAGVSEFAIGEELVIPANVLLAVASKP